MNDRLSEHAFEGFTGSKIILEALGSLHRDDVERFYRNGPDEGGWRYLAHKIPDEAAYGPDNTYVGVLELGPDGQHTLIEAYGPVDRNAGAMNILKANGWERVHSAAHWMPSSSGLTKLMPVYTRNHRDALVREGAVAPDLESVKREEDAKFMEGAQVLGEAIIAAEKTELTEETVVRCVKHNGKHLGTLVRDLAPATFWVVEWQNPDARIAHDAAIERGLTVTFESPDAFVIDTVATFVKHEIETGSTFTHAGINQLTARLTDRLTWKPGDLEVEESTEAPSYGVYSSEHADQLGADDVRFCLPRRSYAEFQAYVNQVYSGRRSEGWVELYAAYRAAYAVVERGCE